MNSHTQFVFAACFGNATSPSPPPPKGFSWGFLVLPSTHPSKIDSCQLWVACGEINWEDFPANGATQQTYGQKSGYFRVQELSFHLKFHFKKEGQPTGD